MPQRILTQTDLDNQQALDTDLQITSATGANDIKWPTAKKLFNWRTWFMSLVNTFTNITDSISTSTGAVVISGGLGVMKSLFTKSLTVTDLAGSGSRIVSTDSNGLLSAPFIITAPTVTDNLIQANMTTEAYWNDFGNYIGPAISNGVQNQFYKNPSNMNFLYFMYDSTTPVRIPVAGQQHLRGMSGTPAWAYGNSAGTGPSGSGVGGNDMGFAFNFTTGTSPVANGTIATITFNKAYNVAVRSITMEAGNAATCLVMPNIYPANIGTTSFTISIGNGGQLAAATNYIIYVTIIC